ncbi:hypothetical protein [Methanoregula sp.]|uniref:hypothetical protein n=1 Tax=Methanoregula sp. TaxID=2052170 RepID=UPI0026257E00|nr:hypothetical protein [Methanoregula sp.]MDD5144453.1 hypothetical protein [Methanoregula sp.]
MDKKIYDRLPMILLLLIGIILVADIVNVFALGGPSLFTLLVKPAGAGSDGKSSPSSGFTGTSAPGNVSASGAAGSAIFVPTTGTPVPVVSYVSVVTPVINSEDQPVYRTLAAPSETPEESSYAYIYSGDLSYYLGEAPTAMNVNVREPPLVIEYEVTPLIIHDSKVGGNRTTSAKKAGTTDELLNITYICPQSEFTVTIYDPRSRQKIMQDGFGLEYGHITKKTFTIRNAGEYIVQFDGNQVDAHVDMKIKREGNII